MKTHQGQMNAQPQTSGNDAPVTGYRINDRWLFTPTELSVKVDDQTHALRRKNAEVLHTLLQNNNQTVSNEALYTEVWGESCVSEGVIKRSICDLRNLLGDDDKTIIVTVPRHGYRLVAEVEACTQSPVPMPVAAMAAEIPAAQPEDATQSEPQTPANPWFIHLFWLTATVICGVWIWLLSAKPAEQNSHPALSQSLLLQTLASQIKDSTQRDKVLEEVNNKLQAMTRHNPERRALATELVSLYNQFALFEQAITLNKKLVLDSEKAHGRFHQKTLVDNRLMIDTLLRANRLQAAYDLARMNLDNTLEHQGKDTLLLAQIYMDFSRVNLRCLYPQCDSKDTKKHGLASAEKAVALLEAQDHTTSVTYADALYLKNWFIYDFDEKYQLLMQALTIYLDTVGRHDQRTADVYLQLGRLHAVWKNNDNEGIEHIEQALSIYRFLYGEQDKRTIHAKYMLGQRLLATGQFAQARGYLSQIVDLDDPDWQCTTQTCTKSLIDLTKTWLYQGEIEQARRLAKRMDESGHQELPFSIAQEAKNVRLKIQSLAGTAPATPAQIQTQLEQNHAAGRAAGNHHALYSVAHELHHQQLRYFPQSLDATQYMDAITLLFAYEYSSNFSDADRAYVLNRAVQYCANHSQDLCDQIKAAPELQ